MQQNNAFVLIGVGVFFIITSLFLLYPSTETSPVENPCLTLLNDSSLQPETVARYALAGKYIFADFFENNPNLFVARSSFKPHYYIVTSNPALDVHVSAHMQDSGGFYDRQVHYALDMVIQKNNGQCGLVFDVGANLGTVTLYAAAKGCKKIYSFELQQEVSQKLDLSIKLSGFEDRVTLMKNTAVSSEDGKIVKYHSFPANPGGVGISANPAATLSATTTTLDTFYYETTKSDPEPIFFMKMDIEGHEVPAMQGAQKLLKNQVIKNLAIELRVSQKDLMKELYSHGYICKDIRSTTEQRSQESIYADERSSYLLENQLDEYFNTMTTFVDFFCQAIRK